METGLHEGLWQQINGLDSVETAQRAKCQYLPNPKRYVITLLNAEYVVNLADRRIYCVQGCSAPVSAEFLEQLCLLAYLINAKDLPLADKLVKAESLPGGQFFFRGLHRLPTGKLEKSFSRCPDLLYRIMERFGAVRCEFGDASIKLYVLPSLPLTIVIWGCDDEFAGRASILFDQTACAQLPLDALLVAVNLAVDALVNADTESGSAARHPRSD